MRRPDLSLPSDFQADPASRPGRRAAASPGRKAARSEEQIVGERLRGWLHRDKGKLNVRQGRVHPALYTLLRRIQRNFRPTPEVLARVPRDHQGERWRAYVAAASRFGRSSMPLPGGDQREPHRGELLPEFQAQNEMLAAGREAARKLSYEACVVAAAGTSVKIVRRKRSGVRALDRVARRAVRAAVRELQMPTDMPRSRACYRLVVRYGKNPTGNPTQLSCNFIGLSRGKPSCEHFFGDHFLARVSLDRVNLLARPDRR